MKIAIISDIHSNPTALLTVLKDIEQQKCDRIVCLGDIVGYGYDPNACIDICREREIECLLGNHDAGLVGSLSLDWFNPFAKNAILRQRPLVTEENKRWLAHLPYNRREGENAFAHGVYVPDMHIVQDASVYFDYVNGYSDAVSQFNLMCQFGIRILFVGHTHYANAFVQENSGEIHEHYIDTKDWKRIDTKDKERIYVGGNHRFIINVGSVGYPRNQANTIYGILDTDTLVFKHRILPFNFHDYIIRMQEADAPVPLWVLEQKKRAEGMYTI